MCEELVLPPGDIFVGKDSSIEGIKSELAPLSRLWMKITYGLEAPKLLNLELSG